MSAPALLHALSHPLAELGVGRSEVGHAALNDPVTHGARGHRGQAGGDIVHQALPGIGWLEAVELPGLGEVVAFPLVPRIGPRASVGGQRRGEGSPDSTGPSKLLGS